MKKIRNSLLWLVAAMLLSAPVLTACGGDDPVDEPTPVNPSTPTDPTEPKTPTVTACQGWPESYDGVMLQGFWWDSYEDSRWAVLTSQAEELSEYFQLIWVPNSGKTSEFAHTGGNTMGYDPCYWLDHNSCWGTETELREMIGTFRRKGTGIIEDVVINHKNGLTSWVDFPNETRGAYSLVWDNTTFTGICRTDECNRNGYKTAGANDTGDNFDGYRDLDHTNAQVQQNVKTYLDYLTKELGYVGFRYDMVKGYAAKYTGMYNASAQPTYSVGECWDGNKTVVVDWLNGTKQNGQIQSAAFDFPLKYRINDAFGNASWQTLRQGGLATDPTYQRYAVTFVDNHDTYRDDNRLRTNVCAANAYILCMPGTPCVFLKHWQSNKGTLKRLIALRRAAGINSQSTIAETRATTKGFVMTVKGSKGSVTLVLGDPDEGAEPTQGAGTDNTAEELAVSGKNFRVYTSQKAALTAVRAITDTDAEPEDTEGVVIPDFCKFTATETYCAFFEAPQWWTTVTCWAWNAESNFTGGSWPGTTCEMIGQRGTKNVWKWSYSLTTKEVPTGIIFSRNGDDQTPDLLFENGGYYTEDGLIGTVSRE